jgi:hypothetical protein
MTPKGADGRQSASDGASYGSVEKKKRAELLSHHTLVLRRPREREGDSDGGDRRWRPSFNGRRRRLGLGARERRERRGSSGVGEGRPREALGALK